MRKKRFSLLLVLGLLVLPLMTGCPTSRFNTEGTSADIQIEAEAHDLATVQQAKEAAMRFLESHGFNKTDDPEHTPADASFERYIRPGKKTPAYDFYFNENLTTIVLRDENRNYDTSPELRKEIEGLIAVLEQYFARSQIRFDHWLHFDLDP